MKDLAWTIFAAIFFILVLPLALAKYVTPRWAARSFVWRVKEFKTEIRKAIIFATPLNILALFLIWEDKGSAVGGWLCRDSYFLDLLDSNCFCYCLL